MPLVRQLVISRYKSTEEANRLLSTLAAKSGWHDHVISRIAITRSLGEPSQPPPITSERKGKELRGETLFRSSEDSAFLPWCVAMIAEHAGEAFRDDDHAIELVIAHWHRGIDLLSKELEELKGDFNELLLSLARRASAVAASAPAGIEAPVYSGSVKALTVPIGRIRADVDPFTITFNDTKKYSNCHTAISGMSGSGKTQFAMQILATLGKAAGPETGIIFIDYAKGDVAGNKRFASSIGASVIRLPGDVLPIGPFHLPEYSDDAIRLAAEEKREVYSGLFANIGPKQQGRLVSALRSSYGSLRGDKEPAPDLAYVQHMLDQLYQADGIQPDSLSELMRRLNAYKLFWSRDGGVKVVSPLHLQRWIVDVHDLGGLKEVTAFTLIEQLYREMRRLPDSLVDQQSGLRHIRCVLAIDEAQYYLRAKNRFLQGIIREGRSKGFMVMLMCQSPDDFDQADFDYTEQLQFTYMLQCKTETKAVQRLLGVSREEAKRLSTELGRMEPLNGLGRNAAMGGMSRFRVVPFFEMYK